jgi:zinc transport system permease protein
MGAAAASEGTMELIETIAESLRYSFIHRALFAGCFIALSCSSLGIFLVLRRFSLIGDGLSHVSLATIAFGMLIGASPLYISFPLVILASLLILRLAEKTVMYGDAAIGIVASLGIASGVLIASMAGGYNVDLFSYLFGSILAINWTEVWLAISLSAIVIILISLFYHDLFSVTFDEEFARTAGIKAGWINRILVILTAITVVLGIRVVGTLLVSSLIIFPAMSALQLSRGFKAAILFAALFGLISIVTGIFISYLLNLPTGATIVVTNFLCFIAAFAIGKFRHS